MKTIYLLRHADAEFSQDTDDFNRRLSPKGLEDAGHLKQAMQDGGYAPNIVYCSPATRTQMTFDILGLSTNNVTRPKELYSGTAGDYLHTLQSTDNAHDHVLLVGHNPSIHEIVRLLAKQRDDMRLLSYRPCTLTILETNIENWADLTPANASIKDVITTG